MRQQVVYLLALCLCPAISSAVESFSAICTQTDGRRYEHAYYENPAGVDKELRDSVEKGNTWKTEGLFVSNPVSLRYVAGEDFVLVDEQFRFRLLTQDENKLAFIQVADNDNVFNQNTYLVDLKSMKATYSRLRIYRGSLAGIMSGQFSLDCKVSRGQPSSTVSPN